VSVVLTPELRAALEARARREQRSLSAMAAVLIAEALGIQP
jgi:hypothetical protein